MPLSTKLSLAIILSLLLFSLCGCGENTVVGASQSKQEESVRCSGCHIATVSRVTGMSIVDEWLLSGHNRNSGSGCADCHEPHQNHPDAGSCNRCHGGTAVAADVTTEERCSKCHTENGGFSRSLRAHFNNSTSAGYPAGYASSQYVKNCRACHNPHDTSTHIPLLRDWSLSGHGQTTSPPWTIYDFKTPLFGDSASACNRCHTTTGYIKYVTSGDSRPWGVTEDKTKETLMCNGCHTGYDYSLQALAPVSAPYKNGKNRVLFPDAKASNLCIHCHSGRESGESVRGVADFSNADFIDPHYLATAGVLFGKSGYHFSDDSGGRNYELDPEGDVHYKLGTGLITGKNGFDALRSNYKGGPCVTCHLTSKSGTHTLKVVTIYSATDTSLNPVCGTATCHPSLVPTGVNPSSSGGASPNSYQTWLGDSATANMLAGSTRKARYQAALAALEAELRVNGFVHDAAKFPVFATKNWGNANNMGAAFNYQLLLHDRGGMAHNRRYTRRLIYDSIDWLDDNSMNHSVYNTLKKLPDTAVYRENAISYLINLGRDGVNADFPLKQRF